MTSLSEHENFCGNKTEQCTECYEWTMLKDWDAHQGKLHGSYKKRFAEGAGINSTLEVKGRPMI